MPLFSDSPDQKRGRGLPSGRRSGLFSDEPSQPYEIPDLSRARKQAMPQAPKPKSEEGFLARTGRAALGGLEKGIGTLVEYLPETVVSGLGSTVDILAQSRGLPKGLGESIVRQQAGLVVTPENVAAYRQAVKPVSSALIQEGTRQQQLAGPATFKAPSEQETFSLGETLKYGGEQFLRSSGSTVAGLAVGALTRSPAAARAVMGAGSYGETLSGVLESQQQQGFQDVDLAAKASLASAALDVLTGGEAKVAQAASKEVKKQLFKEGAVGLTKDILKIGATESGTETLQTGIERYGARKELFTREAINEYIDSAAAGFGGGVIMGGGVRLLTGNRKPTQDVGSAGSDLLDKKTEADAQADAAKKPFVAPDFVEKDADDNDVVNMETIRANPKMALDQLSELYSRDNIITSLAGSNEADGYVTSLGARVHRAIKSQNPKSIPNLVRSLKRDIDPDIHGEDVAAQRSPLVSKAALMLGDYVGLRNEAMAADERATNPNLIAEQVAAKNSEEVARVEAINEQQQAEATAEQARAEAERQTALDTAAKEVERIHRAGIMEAVSKDPKTRDPVARFQALLKRNGFSPELTAEEQVALTKASVNAEQRLAAEAAQMDMTVAEYKQKLAEDEARQREAESGTASMEALIPEAGTKQPAPAKPKAPEMAPGKTNRAAPENFQLEAQTELTDADIAAQQKAAARRQAKADRELAKSNARAERRAARAQGELFTPTGRPAKAAVQAPKVTVATQIKEKVSAAKEGQKPKGRVAERVGADEKRKAAEASRRNRPEPSTKKRQEATQAEEKVTHEQVADRAVEARQNGYINEVTRQRIALLAEQKKVPAETLSKMLDQAVEKQGLEQKLPQRGGFVADGILQAIYRFEDAWASLTGKQRPADGKLVDLLRDKDVIAKMNPLQREVAATLADVIRGDVKVSIGNKNFTLDEAGNAGQAVFGVGETPFVQLRGLSTARQVQTLIHEAVHIALVSKFGVGFVRLKDLKRLNNIPEMLRLRADAIKLMDAYDAMIEATRSAAFPPYGMSNIDEFVAEGMTNPKFQKFLDKGSMWTQFVEFIRKALGMPPKFQSQLATVLEAGANLIEGSQGLSRMKDVDAAPETPERVRLAKRLSGLPDFARRPILRMSDTFANHTGRFLTALGFTENLIEDAKKLIPAMGDYLDLMQKKMSEKERIETGVNSIRERFQRLGLARQTNEVGTINHFLQETVDAAEWGFKPSWLEDGEYTVNPELEAMFKRLPAVEQQIVKDTLQSSYNMLQLKIKTAVDSVNALYDGLIEQAIEADDTAKMNKLDIEKKNALAQYQGIFRARQNVPYVSKRRNGDYVVVAKSEEMIAAQEAKDQKLIDKLASQEEHYFVDMYDSMAEAQEVKRELAEKGSYSTGSIRASETDKATQQFLGSRDMMVAYERLRSQIQQLATSPDGQSGPSKKVVKDMERLAIDLYLTSLQNTSARKAEMKKRNVASGQLDMMRNFVSQGVAEANLIASMMYTGKVEKALREMRAQAFSDRQSNPEQAARYYNEIALRHASSMGYTPESWAEFIKSATSMMLLALSPSYYATNLTQPWVLSVPYMAGEHNYDKVVAEMLSSYEEVTKAWKDVPLLNALDLDKVSDDVREGLKVLAERGKIDVGMNKELGQFASLNKNAALNAFDKGGTAIRAVAQKVESINRVSTAAAAIRLAKSKGLSEQQAIDYADRVIRLTHGPYDSFNAPRWMRGPVLSTVTQFKKFQLMQLTLIGKLVAGSVSRANTPEAKLERAVVRRQLAFTLGHTGVLTGVKGLFGYSAITFLINTILNAISDDDDEPADIEKTIRDSLGEYADVIMSGAPALAGLDLSDRIGMGQALSVIPYVEPELSRKGWEKAVIGILGPGIAVGGKVADALGFMYNGDYLRGLEMMLPNGLDDGVKAFRESTQGVTTRKGDVLLKPDEMTFGDTFAGVMGLRTTKVSERYRKQTEEKKLDQFYKDRTSELKSEYIEALDAGDSAKQAEVRKKWLKTQDARAAAGKNRQPISLLLKARAERNRQESLTVGGVQYRAKDARYRAALAEEEEQ